MDTVLFPLNTDFRIGKFFQMEDTPNMRPAISMAVVFISLLAAIPSQAQSQTQAKGSADIDAIKYIEVEMGNAFIAGDLDKLNQIFADDYAVLGSSSRKAYTKKDLLSGLENDKLLWFETGPIDVQVFGNVGLGQGMVNEKRLRNGKDTRVQALWMDILEKRAGKWVVVRSGSGKVDLAGSAKARPADSSAIEAIKKFEQNVGDAMVAVDVDSLNRMYADDWTNLGLSSSEVFTKESLLRELKSGEHKLASFELGSMNVQVFGDAAVFQASVNENRIQDGKDISGQFAFMDLLKKRAGKWVIVRTLAARVS